MRRTTLSAHRQAIERNGGPVIRGQRESARRTLLADIRSGSAAQATAIKIMQERIDDVTYRWVHRSAKVAQARGLLAEAAVLVARMAGGRPLMPFLAAAPDVEGTVLRLQIIARILSAMGRLAARHDFPNPLTPDLAMVLDALQER